MRGEFQKVIEMLQNLNYTDDIYFMELLNCLDSKQWYYKQDDYYSRNMNQFMNEFVNFQKSIIQIQDYFKQKQYSEHLIKFCDILSGKFDLDYINEKNWKKMLSLHYLFQNPTFKRKQVEQFLQELNENNFNISTLDEFFLKIILNKKADEYIELALNSRPEWMIFHMANLLLLKGQFEVPQLDDQNIDQALVYEYISKMLSSNIPLQTAIPYLKKYLNESDPLNNDQVISFVQKFIIKKIGNEEYILADEICDELQIPSCKQFMIETCVQLKIKQSDFQKALDLIILLNEKQSIQMFQKLIIEQIQSNQQIQIEIQSIKDQVDFSKLDQSYEDFFQFIQDYQNLYHFANEINNYSIDQIKISLFNLQNMKNIIGIWNIILKYCSKLFNFDDPDIFNKEELCDILLTIEEYYQIHSNIKQNQEIRFLQFKILDLINLKS